MKFLEKAMASDGEAVVGVVEIEAEVVGAPMAR